MANENQEPIHVHISKGNPTANSTKVWITKSGDCILVNNDSRISKQDLSKIFKSIQYNYFYILSEWKIGRMFEAKRKTKSYNKTN